MGQHSPKFKEPVTQESLTLKMLTFLLFTTTFRGNLPQTVSLPQEHFGWGWGVLGKGSSADDTKTEGGKLSLMKYRANLENVLMF